MEGYVYFIVLLRKWGDIRVQNTRQKCHYQVLLCRTNLGKCGLRYVGASVRNRILSVSINPNVCDFIFSRSLKAAISDIKVMYHIYFWCMITRNIIPVIISVAPSALVIFETKKKNINPTGFPAPFAPLISYYFICTGNDSLYRYECQIYYTVFDGKQ